MESQIKNFDRPLTKTERIYIILVVYFLLLFWCVLGGVGVYQIPLVQSLIKHEYVQVPCKLTKYVTYQTMCYKDDKDGMYRSANRVTHNDGQKPIQCKVSNQTWEIMLNNVSYSYVFVDEDLKKDNIRTNTLYTCYCQVTDPTNSIRFDDGINRSEHIAIISAVLFSIVLCISTIFISMCCPYKPSKITTQKEIQPTISNNDIIIVESNVAEHISPPRNDPNVHIVVFHTDT